MILNFRTDVYRYVTKKRDRKLIISAQCGDFFYAQNYTLRVIPDAGLLHPVRPPFLP